MKKLFLDDLRMPQSSGWDIVRNYHEFVAYIEKNGVPEIISFDHDLSTEHYVAYELNQVYKGREKTGYDCAKWLIESNLGLPKFVNVHSWNPDGGDRIAAIMKSAGCDVVVSRYGVPQHLANEL